MVRKPIEQTGYSKFNILKDGFKPSWIVVHHSFSSDGNTRNWDDIRKYHMSYRQNGNTITQEEYYRREAASEHGLEKPWSDIGYNFGIENVNGKITILDGRAIGAIGAHAIGFNANSIGICLVGHYDIDPPSEDRLFAVASLCRDLQRIFKIPRDQVIGHRETFEKRGVPVEKTCPGILFDMTKFRGRLLA